MHYSTNSADHEQWAQLMHLVDRVRKGFADMNPAELDSLIDEAVEAARAEKRAIRESSTHTKP